MKLEHFVTPYTKINPKYKTEKPNIPKRKQARHWLKSYRYLFLDLSPKAKKIKAKINKNKNKHI